MSSTPVRYPTPNASNGSPQHTSVGVTDPLLWQGLRQVKAKGRAPAPRPRGLDLFLLFLTAGKVSCPYNLQLQMGPTWAWSCDGIGGGPRTSSRGGGGGHLECLGVVEAR